MDKIDKLVNDKIQNIAYYYNDVPFYWFIMDKKKLSLSDYDFKIYLAKFVKEFLKVKGKFYRCVDFNHNLIEVNELGVKEENIVNNLLFEYQRVKDSYNDLNVYWFAINPPSKKEKYLRNNLLELKNDVIFFDKLLLDKKTLKLTNKEFIDYLEQLFKEAFDMGAKLNTNEFSSIPKEIAVNIVNAYNEFKKSGKEDYLFTYNYCVKLYGGK